MISRWRIIEADIWDRDYLEQCIQVTITIETNSCGEIAFGVMEVNVKLGYSRSMVSFTRGPDSTKWMRSPATVPESLDDGSIELIFAYHHNGDEAPLQAIRVTSSAAC